MVQAYYALRASVDDEQRAALKSQLLQSVVSIRARCGLPPVEPRRDQGHDVLPEDAAACVTAAYGKLRDGWAARLTGPAAQEASRAADRNVEIQGKLQDLGFVPGRVSDGVFGTATRDGIKAWQSSVGRPATGFLDDAAAAILEGKPWTADAATADPVPAVKPLEGPLGFDGKPIEIVHGDLSARLTSSTGGEPSACDIKTEDLFGSNSATKPPCTVVRLSVSVAGREVLSAPIYALEMSDHLEDYRIKVAISRLASGTGEPQVLVTGYSGGAHCCDGAEVATQVGEAWRLLPLGERDGEEPWQFVLFGETPVLAGKAPGFDYRFSSYAGSYAPTRIERLEDGKLVDVSREPRYRSYMQDKLSEMEALRAKSGHGEPNGFLAGWVAQKAYVGELAEGWRTMEATFDREGGTDTRCVIDKEAWIPDARGSKSCPASGYETVPFPVALAVFLVDRGYMTKDEASGLGYDVGALEASQKARDAVATARWTRHVTQDWFVLARDSTCKAATAPKSPAEMVTGDLASGVKDEITIIEKAEGKPVHVAIGRPEGNGLFSTVTFFRGLRRCTEGLAGLADKFDELR